MSQTTVTVQQARDNFAQLIERAALANDSFLVTKFGKPKAVIIAADQVKRRGEKLLVARKKALAGVLGMWANRKDMADSAKWVTDLRRREAYRLYEQKSR